MATVNRRHFLQRLSGAAGAAALFGAPQWAWAAGELRGIYPILQTPFKEDLTIDQKDFDKQVEFQIKCGTHGVVWPQLASEFFDLSVDERMTYPKRLVTAVRGRCKVVIGVQATETESAVAYAKNATACGADAVIALPPYASNGTIARVMDHYHRIAAATPLPMFLQISTGNWGPRLSVDDCLQLARECSNIRYIKEEVSPVPERVRALVTRGKGLLDGVFTGNGGRHLLNEIRHGSTGCMPAAHLTDVYVTIWDLEHAGDHAEARIAFNRLLALITFGGLHRGFPKLILKKRGVFKTALYRTGRATAPLDDYDRKELDTLMAGVKPYMKV